jgi:hypothetical protein
LTDFEFYVQNPKLFLSLPSLQWLGLAVCLQWKVAKCGSSHSKNVDFFHPYLLHSSWLGPDTGYPNWVFRGFPQSFHAISGIAHLNYSTAASLQNPFQITMHLSLSFDVIYSYLAKKNSNINHKYSSWFLCVIPTQVVLILTASKWCSWCCYTDISKSSLT